LQERGEELTGDLVRKVQLFQKQVSSNFDIPIFLTPAEFAQNRFDPAKVVLRVNQLGASGVEIERELITAGVKVEMADRDTIVFLVTLVDTQVQLQKLAEVLIPILKRHQRPPRPSATSLSWSVKPQQIISMRDAYFADTEFVSTEAAVGRISADLIAPYPPGVAVVAPGELLTAEIVNGLVTTQAAGVRIAYASDATLKTFRVVK
jgi:lysine decarboxylase